MPFTLGIKTRAALFEKSCCVFEAACPIVYWKKGNSVINTLVAKRYRLYHFLYVLNSWTLSEYLIPPLSMKWANFCHVLFFFLFLSLSSVSAWINQIMINVLSLTCLRLKSPSLSFYLWLSAPYFISCSLSPLLIDYLAGGVWSKTDLNVHTECTNAYTHAISPSKLCW